MASIHRYTYQPSGKIEEIIDPSGHYYVLPDGRRVEMDHHRVWCFGCNDLSWAEYLRPVEEVEQDIRTWKDPDSVRRKTELDEYEYPDQKQYILDRELRSAYAYRDLLLARTEPCHCIKCGGTHLVGGMRHGMEFPLPDGTGTVTWTWVGYALVGGPATYYTPNGHRMPPREVPPWPPEPRYPDHYKYGWTDYLFMFAVLVTSPMWGPIVLVVRLVNWLSRSWHYFRYRRRFPDSDPRR